MRREPISSPRVHTYRPGGEAVAYANAVRISEPGSLVYISGQVAFDENGSVIGTTIEEQARQALSNVKALIEAAGGRMDDIFKLNTFIKSRDLVPAYVRLRNEFFKDLPVSTTVVTDFVENDLLIEIEAVAALP
jgi:2-iminobutanoate/2-iminopropanoate deaminase